MELTILDKQYKLNTIPLKLSPNAPITKNLQSISGSQGIHVLVNNNGEIILQAEIDTFQDESIDVIFSLNEHNKLIISAKNRQIRYLPRDKIYKPDPEIPNIPMVNKSYLDLLIVIDGTMRQRNPPGISQKKDKNSIFAVQDKGFMEKLTDKLVQFINSLSETFPDLRVSILVFGDHNNIQYRASDLKPSYVLESHPADKCFIPWEKDEFKNLLMNLKGSYGGDYIDAVADALQETLIYNWRAKARKLLVLIGDSPGFSLLNPAPIISESMVANTTIRDIDIDTQILALYTYGIETLTLFIEQDLNPSKVEYNISNDSLKSKFLEYTKKQYSSMASTSGHTYSFNSWDTAKVANYLSTINKPIGHAYTYPVIAE